MTQHDPNSQQTAVQPSLADLTARYLQKQSEALEAGLIPAEESEVQLFEAGPVQPIDAKPAWEEALAVLRLLGAGVPKGLKAPPGWPQLVATHAPAVDLAFCLGNFPQLVRNLALLLHPGLPSSKRGASSKTPASAPAVVEWAGQQSQYPQVLLALAGLRMTGQFAEADRLIAAHEASVPASWRAVWENEKAALEWHRGNVEQARELWQRLPDSVPVLFNRGMAGLFTDRRDEAGQHLKAAIAQLPETSAWHHLASLYLTLAETREV